MAKIAIDIALLLPEEISKICIDINQKESSESYSDLSKENNYPHITLAMGVIDKKDIEKGNSKLKDITKEFSKLNLRILKLYSTINSENKKSCGFKIQTTKELKEIHATIMRELSPLFSYKVKDEMFFLDPDETFADISKTWVEAYGENHSDPENYHPHISLKCRKAEYDKVPIDFTASELVLCHLGNHCTCREILGKFKLEDSIQ